MRIISYILEMNENQHGILIEDKSCVYPGTFLSNPQTVVAMLNSVFHLNKRAEECVFMIALNSKCKPLGIFEISHGTATASLCNPREIFIRALLCGATRIILAHNHPSGDINPSEDDITIYQRIQEAGELIGVPLIDNLIIGNDFFSFTEGLQNSNEIINLDKKGR